MKKTMAVTGLLAVMLLAAGCGKTAATPEKTSESTSSAVSQKASSAAGKPSKQAASDKKASATSSETKADANATSGTQPSAPAGDRLTAVNGQIRQTVSGALLPTAFNANGGVINADFSGNNANYHIYYNTGAQAQPVNSGAANHGNATFALQKVTYSSAAAAQAQISYRELEQGLPTVALGDNQTATQQGAAGSTYTTWHEGNWSITVQAVNQTGDNGTNLAKQAVALFAKKALPAPDGQASVYLFASPQSDRANRIMWRKGNALYYATGTNAMDLLTAATALK